MNFNIIRKGCFCNNIRFYWIEHEAGLALTFVVKFVRYEESNLKVSRKKTNLMFIGDGKGKTVITGGRNVKEGLTTFHTASFGKFAFASCVWKFVSLN